MRSSEFTAKMIEKFPHLFNEENSSINRYGFETGPGWNSLVEEALSKLSQTAKLVQVKEKFGGLRMYVDNATEDDYKVIGEAEVKSEATCEECGKPGKIVNKNRWMRSLCDEHAS